MESINGVREQAEPGQNHSRMVGLRQGWWQDRTVDAVD